MSKFVKTKKELLLKLKALGGTEVSLAFGEIFNCRLIKCIQPVFTNKENSILILGQPVSLSSSTHYSKDERLVFIEGWKKKWERWFEDCKNLANAVLPIEKWGKK